MRIIECRQQTEEWERWRNRPTASEFGSFVTPVKGDYAKQSTAYAAKIVAKRLGVYTEPPPTYWMEWGVEQEPNARAVYQDLFNIDVREVGFVLPDHSDAYGGSPDGLVGHRGLLEIKCPAPETLIAYHAAGAMPVKYRPQIQGLLMITDCAWCDLFVFHPELTPFNCRISADVKYQEKIAKCLLMLLDEIETIENRVKRVHHNLVNPTRDNVQTDA